MKSSHPGIKIESDGIIDGEEMYVDGGGLTDTDSATTCLMNDGGIPVLREEENTTTEL